MLPSNLVWKGFTIEKTSLTQEGEAWLKEKENDLKTTKPTEKTHKGENKK